MSTGWGDDDWGTDTPVTKIPTDEDDGWGPSTNTTANNNDNTNKSSNQSFDSPKGMGPGLAMGRAKRMQQWRESRQTHDNSCGQKSESNRQNIGNDSKRKIQIPSSFVGKVIGKGGQTIKDLQFKSGAKISVNKGSNGSGYKTDIDLSGTTDQMDCAERLINDLISNNNRNTNNYNNSYNKSESKSETKSQSSPTEEMEFIDWGAAIKESEEATKRKWAALPPISKHFYFENEEIRTMKPEAVDQFRRQSNNIMVNHFNESDTKAIPNPVLNFFQAFEHFDEILGEIKKVGFETPSPIQCQLWPILLSGYDSICMAQIGADTTLAYLLPALIHIDCQPIKRSERVGATVVILVMSVEDVDQTYDFCHKFSYRGIVMRPITDCDSVSDLKGVELLVTTPGRLVTLNMNKVIDLSSVSYLVLDGVNKMTDENRNDLTKLLISIRPDRQFVLISNNWSPDVIPMIRQISDKYMSDPLQVKQIPGTVKGWSKSDIPSPSVGSPSSVAIADDILNDYNKPQIFSNRLQILINSSEIEIKNSMFGIIGRSLKTTDLKNNFHVNICIDTKLCSQTILTIIGVKENRDLALNKIRKAVRFCKVSQEVNDGLKTPNLFCYTCHTNDHDLIDCKNCGYCFRPGHQKNTCSDAKEAFKKQQAQIISSIKSSKKEKFEKNMASITQTDKHSAERSNDTIRLRNCFERMGGDYSVYFKKHINLNQLNVSVFSMDIETGLVGNIHTPIEICMCADVKRGQGIQVVYHSYIQDFSVTDIKQVFNGIPLTQLENSAISLPPDMVRNQILDLLKGDTTLILFDSTADLKYLAEIGLTSEELQSIGCDIIDISEEFLDQNNQRVNLADIYHILFPKNKGIQSYDLGEGVFSGHNIEKDTRATFKIWKEFVRRKKSGEHIPSGQEIRDAVMAEKKQKKVSYPF